MMVCHAYDMTDHHCTFHPSPNLARDMSNKTAYIETEAHRYFAKACIPTGNDKVRAIVTSYLTNNLNSGKWYGLR